MKSSPRSAFRVLCKKWPTFRQPWDYLSPTPFSMRRVIAGARKSCKCRHRERTSTAAKSAVRSTGVRRAIDSKDASGATRREASPSAGIAHGNTFVVISYNSSLREIETRQSGAAGLPTSSSYSMSISREARLPRPRSLPSHRAGCEEGGGKCPFPQRERQRAVRSTGNYSARSPSQVRKLQATWRAAALPSVHSVLFSFLKP